jgi:vancomycin resistance protein YoaR
MRVGKSLREYGPMHRRRGDVQQNRDHEPPDSPPAREAEPRTRSARARVRRRRALRRHTTGKAQQQRGFPVRLLAGGMLMLAVLVLTLPYTINLLYAGQALPGVTVQGWGVAELNQQQIADVLEGRYDDFAQQPLTLTYGAQTWNPTLEDLGARFDGTQVGAEALHVGRQGDPLTRLATLWQLWRGGIDVAPHIAVDRQQLQHYLLGVAAEMNHAPRDARLNIAHDNVSSVASVQGLQTLVDETANDIMLSLRTLTPQDVPLRTRLLEPMVNDEAALAAEERANELLSSPLVLRHNDEQWVWDAEQIAALLRVERAGPHLLVQIDEDQLTTEVAELALAIDSGSVEPRLRFDGSSLQVVQEGQIGWNLQQDAAIEDITAAIRESQPTTHTVTLPADEIRPQVEPENLASLGIHELVGEGKSSFAGSAAYRITNIKAGAARMDGVLIPPDSEFSFNTQLGEVNGENGFVEGYAVVGNRTTLEWGGGVCQDSTTVFRAAFWAGLPITERHGHPFYISWYDRFGLGPYGDGQGLDAAIFTGQDDLRFINDTGNWLLMQVNVDEANQVLTVQLYGTNPDNRTVEIDGPYITNEVSPPAAPQYIDDPSKPAGYLMQTDAARNGRDITITRIVLENGHEIRRDQFHTHFRAWPNIYVRGTGG